MSHAMLHGLGDCTQERNCGCLVVEPNIAMDQSLDLVAGRWEQQPLPKPDYRIVVDGGNRGLYRDDEGYLHPEPGSPPLTAAELDTLRALGQKTRPAVSEDVRVAMHDAKVAVLLAKVRALQYQVSQQQAYLVELTNSTIVYPPRSETYGGYTRTTNYSAVRYGERERFDARRVEMRAWDDARRAARQARRTARLARRKARRKGWDEFWSPEAREWGYPVLAYLGVVLLTMALPVLSYLFPHR